jgi:hypothetical protein
LLRSKVDREYMQNYERAKVVTSIADWRELEAPARAAADDVHVRRARGLGRRCGIPLMLTPVPSCLLGRAPWNPARTGPHLPMADPAGTFSTVATPRA